MSDPESADAVFEIIAVVYVSCNDTYCQPLNFVSHSRSQNAAIWSSVGACYAASSTARDGWLGIHPFSPITLRLFSHITRRVGIDMAAQDERFIVVAVHGEPGSNDRISCHYFHEHKCCGKQAFSCQGHLYSLWPKM